MNYTDKLKDPRWQKKRLAIMERDGWKCLKCLDEKSTLHVHHLSYSGEPWEAPDDQLVTLCEHCHLLIEVNRLDATDYKAIKFINSNGNVILFVVTGGRLIVFKKVEQDTETISLTSELFSKLLEFFKSHNL